MDIIEYEDFQKVQILSGTVLKAEPFPEARKPAYKLWVDFGEPVGVKKTSAQITHHYTLEALLGKQVMGVVNFKPRQIGPFVSEFLILGFTSEGGGVVLAQPERSVPNGQRLH
jgi:tRNA-binding protein